MWPPSSLERRFACTTIASAFHRISERMRHSMAASPGVCSARDSGMVLMYGVVTENGRFAPPSRA